MTNSEEHSAAGNTPLRCVLRLHVPVLPNQKENKQKKMKNQPSRINYF
jgi:hypothetical protein